MIGRRTAAALAVTLVVLVVAALVVETARASDRRELAAVAAVRAEFGTGQLAGCFLAIVARETGGTFDPHAANWHDHHADGSTGSWGLTQIGSLWRRPGETVQHFRARMWVPAENLRLAHLIYLRYGIGPWGSC